MQAELSGEPVRRFRGRSCRGRIAVACGCALLGPLAMARAADNVSTFRNGTDNWSDPNAWVPVGVPNDGTSTYDAVFNGQFNPLGPDTLKLDENITIQKFTMTGGFLSGPPM